ncbi:MAG: GGDEF domain-containing protein [Deltaproteobacteria bacterium]|nr:GGDEF domain-containing protein [Deltaproteobacteria bacterium]
MKKKLDNARAIVQEIVLDIEKRSKDARRDAAAVNDFQVGLRHVENDVCAECLRGVPDKYIALIREKLGAEIVEALEPGKIGAIFKNRDRVQKVYEKIAVLLEKYNHAQKTAKDSLSESDRLRFVQQEMAESQIANLQELEAFEQRMLQSQWLVELQLEPFEKAMSMIVGFLEARHMEVYLFDDDKFLTTNLDTDGKIFAYNKQSHDGNEPPHTVDAPSFQEVQETIYETPLVVEGRQIGHCRILCTKTENFDRDRWIKKVDLITPVAARVIEANQNRLLAAKVYTDDLTQLYNKRKLNEQMGRLFTQFKSGRKKLFVAMIDIDKFKTLNDTYGHPAGDQVLKKVALLIRDGVPYAYRYGGEEFCAVFYGCEKQAVLDAMEALRKNIEKSSFDVEGLTHAITVSAGIAEFEVTMNAVMDAIDRADKALYVSKEDGRNRCTYYDDIKDRYLADANRLRQRNLILEEEIAQLRQELAGMKGKKIR